MLEAVRDRCVEQVMRYAGRQGFTHSDFFTRVPAYRELWSEEQFRVLVMLAKRPEVSSGIGRRGAWHFWARSLAPPDAFNISDAKRSTAEIVQRAIRETK